MKKNILILLIGVIITASISYVIADTYISSLNVTYKSDYTDKTNVNDALNELFENANNKTIQSNYIFKEGEGLIRPCNMMTKFTYNNNNSSYGNYSRVFKTHIHAGGSYATGLYMYPIDPINVDNYSTIKLEYSAKFTYLAGINIGYIVEPEDHIIHIGDGVFNGNGPYYNSGKVSIDKQKEVITADISEITGEIYPVVYYRADYTGSGDNFVDIFNFYLE